MANFVFAFFLGASTGGSDAWFVAEDERPISALERDELNVTLIVPPEMTWKCPSALGATNEECVDKHVNGHCPNGSQCFAREDLFDKIEYGICCCDNKTTPAWAAIHDKWSCRIQKVRNPSGSEPLCDIFCCTPSGRNGTNKHWAATRCTWLEPKWGWPFALPGSSSRHCCTGLDGASCQTTCDFAQLCCISSMFTVVVAVIAVHCSRKSLRKRHLGIAGLVLVVQAIISQEAARKAGHAEFDSRLWAVLTCAPLLLQCLMIHLRKWRRERRAASENRNRVRLAVFLTIEKYTSNAYANVPDMGKRALAGKLSNMGWDVRQYTTGWHSDFESIRDLVHSQLEGTKDSEVMLYVSCHSFSVGEAPVILRSDAGRFTGTWRSKSLYTMIREMNEVSSTNTRFIVFFDGCLVRPPCNLWWQFIFCACRRSEGLPELRLGGRQVSICCACTPGDEAHVENSLSKAFAQALEEGQGSRPIFESLREKLASGDPPQTLFTTGTRSQIILEPAVDAATQTMTGTESQIVEDTTGAAD